MAQKANLVRKCLEKNKRCLNSARKGQQKVMMIEHDFIFQKYVQISFFLLLVELNLLELYPRPSFKKR